jgi:hypothetical protein
MTIGHYQSVPESWLNRVMSKPGMAILTLVIVAGACSSQETSEPLTTEGVGITPPSTGVTTSGDSSTERLVPPLVTAGAWDGNRIAPGQGSFDGGEPTLTLNDIGVPLWVTAVASGDSSVWAVALDDGTVRFFEVTDGDIADAGSGRLAPGRPPMLALTPDGPQLLVDGSLLTRSILLSDGRPAFIGGGGEVVVAGEAIEVDALPDARLVIDEVDRLAVLGDATDRYPHGILGDDLEAGSISIIETTPEVRVVSQIVLPAPQVVEGLSPIWADLNGDGSREIIVTVSEPGDGAHLAAYAEDGRLVGAGPGFGRSSRWRHQLAVGPFAPDGTLELVAVRTPHIGGVVEYYRLEGGELRLVASLDGHTSHVIGSRNLDMAAGGDFDGDGRLELLLPVDDYTSLSALRRNPDGVDVAWSVPLDGRLATNLATVTLDDGSLIVGGATTEGTFFLLL